jgi:signal peptidase I
MTEQDQIRSKPQSRGWLRVVAIGRNPKMTLARIVILVVTCLIVFKFVLLPVRITGISMLPTLKNGSVNCVNRLAYLFHEPRRGDVVSIRFAGIHVMLMKRIIGLPGETIAFVDGRVLINGEVLDEPYEKLQCDWNLPPEKIGADEYYVVGDNRTMGPEDHVKGRVARERIVGKAIL